MPIGSEVQVQRAGKQPATDLSAGAPRADPYFAPIISSATPSDMHHAEEGAYIVAANPTIGTGMLWVAAETTFSDVHPNFYIENPIGSLRTIWLRRLKLQASAVGTAAVSWRYTVIVDTVFRAFSTDNTQTIVPFSPGPAPLLVTPKVKAQNLGTTNPSVITASSANKKIAALGTLGGLNLIGDELEIVFGSCEVSGFAGAANGAGQPGRRVTQSSPVGIPAGGCGVITFWAPSSSASINPEFELSMIAR